MAASASLHLAAGKPMVSYRQVSHRRFRYKGDGTWSNVGTFLCQSMMACRPKFTSRRARPLDPIWQGQMSGVSLTPSAEGLFSPSLCWWPHRTRFLSHDNLEPAFTISQDTIHFLVGTSFNEGLVNANRTPTYFGLGLDSVEATGLLFEGARDSNRIA
jgi:hypothetical protein